MKKIEIFYKNMQYKIYVKKRKMKKNHLFIAYQSSQTFVLNWTKIKCYTVYK